MAEHREGDEPAPLTGTASLHALAQVSNTLGRRGPGALALLDAVGICPGLGRGTDPASCTRDTARGHRHLSTERGEGAVEHRARARANERAEAA